MTEGDLAGTRRVAILGAGPIGMEAALYGACLGHDITVYERGELGAAVQSWGQVAMFSPWRRNTSALGRQRLAAAGAVSEAALLESPVQCPTGEQYLRHYLLPLSQDPLLRGKVQTQTSVISVGKAGLRKGEQIGQAARAQTPFRLLLEDQAGERTALADVVLDCSGTYGQPNHIGVGGVPAPGERWLRERLIRHLPDVLGRERSRFAKRRVLLVGAGLSAATTICALSELVMAAPGTEVVWAVRKPVAQPYSPIEGDVLPARAVLHREANRIAALGAVSARPDRPSLRYLPGMAVDAIGAEGHRLRVRLIAQGSAGEAAADPSAAVVEELFDEVIGLTGYGPDRDLYRELQVHECYASLGPMKLAATLLGASKDCMAQPAPGPETLRNPEPNFYILGSKSYGRNSSFLLEIGINQIKIAYQIIRKNSDLDLYVNY